MNKPAPALKSAFIARLARSRGPLNRARARRWFVDTLLRRAPVLELYYEAGDPHSHLAAQLLPSLQQRLACTLRVHLVSQDDFVVYPEPERQRRFALADARRIAAAWGLSFPRDALVIEDDVRRDAGRCLASARTLEEFVEREAQLGAALFGGREAALAAIASLPAASDAEAQARIAAGNARRSSLGHYLPGMWQFDGQWFWGLDRLPFLETELRRKRLLDGHEPLCAFDPQRAELPAPELNRCCLEFYFSFRSPYSYLAAVQLQQRRARWKIPLAIRPVLPMAMRGMSIPLRKRLYIPRDCYRLARELDIPFGRIADPIGSGAERCLNTFRLAEGVDQQLAFLVNAGRAVWSEGIDVATDAGLAWVCGQSGIAWGKARESLAAGIDLDYAERNRVALFEHGLWGVPSFTLGEFATWGQDRLWMIEELLRRHDAITEDER